MLSWIFRNRLRLRTIYGHPETPPLPGARFAASATGARHAEDEAELDVEVGGPGFQTVAGYPAAEEPQPPELQSAPQTETRAPAPLPGQIRYRPGQVWRTQRHTLMRPMPPRVA